MLQLIVKMANRKVRTTHRPDGKIKRPDGPLEFEKFRNSFLDTKTVDRSNTHVGCPDARARDSEFELKMDL
jgi:hypothetical protein